MPPSSNPAARPSFTAPDPGADPTPTFELAVNDGAQDSGADTVTVNADVTVPPAAPTFTTGDRSTPGP